LINPHIMTMYVKSFLASLASRGVRGSRPANLIQISDIRRAANRDHVSIPKDKHMNTGTVKFYDGQKGFGLIQPNDGGKDVLVHVSALERAGFPGLAEARKSRFELERAPKGRESAANLQLI